MALRLFCLALLLAALLAGATRYAGEASALEIELNDAAKDRIERQRAFEAGRLPLPATPDVTRFDERLADKGLKLGDPVFIRIFKAESELEIWMRKGERYELFATYPICHWSGTLGPKLLEGDRQAPEGVYDVTKGLLHRAGRWNRALNLGFPNAFDRAKGRTGSYILVHGGCSSVGCYAMTNEVMNEIFALVERALLTGQESVPVHVFPFRMTPENLTAHAGNAWADFWQTLKPIYDAFEESRRPPEVALCENRYAVAAPEEGGPERPLGACGAAQVASQYRNAAPLPAPSETSKSSPQQPSPLAETMALAPSIPEQTRAPKRELSPNVRRELSSAPSSAPANALPLSTSVPSQSAQEREQLPCSLTLASCRRWAYLMSRPHSRKIAEHTTSRRR